MNTVGFRNIEELQTSNGLLKGFNQVVVITDDVLGGTFKTIRKGDAVLDGGVYLQGDSRYDLRRVYDNINVDVVWFGSDLTSFFNYCASKDEYAYMSNGVFDLGGASISLPANLKIKSGAGYFTNGTLIGNNTYFEVNQHHKLFDPSIVFEGEWKGITVTPQNFGAITNKDNTVFENDCSAAIQAAIDSPFKVHFPVGYYYFTEEMYIHKAKSITLEKGLNTGETRHSSYVLDLNQDHARLYTDQDTDAFIIQAEHVYIVGGLIDYSNVELVNYKAAVRYDLNYRMWGGEIDIVVIGNEETLHLHENGISGIIVDNTDITSTAGWLHFVKWNVYGYYVRIGVIVEPRINHSNDIFINSINLNLNLNGFKQAALFEAGGDSKIIGLGQSKPGVRSELEKDLPVLSAISCIVDWFCYDVSTNRGTEAPWGIPDIGITDLGYSVLVGNSYKSASYHEMTVPLTPYPVVNPPNSMISKKHYGDSFLFSELHNQLAAADKRFTVTIKGHSGDGFDFDTLTESGLPDNSEITIVNKENLFLTKASVPPSITFSPLADIDQDFVEFVLSGTIGSIKSLIISFLGDRYLDVNNKSIVNSFKRIQIIKSLSGDRSMVMDSDVQSNLIKINDINTIDTLIIRFIGVRSANTAIRLLDMCSVRSAPNITPHITIDGGQKIYGPLDVDRLRVKSTILEVTPTNGCIESDGTNLYFVVGGVRKQITLTDL